MIKLKASPGRPMIVGLLGSGAKAGRGALDELTASLLPIEPDRQRSSGGASARFAVAVKPHPCTKPI